MAKNIEKKPKACNVKIDKWATIYAVESGRKDGFVLGAVTTSLDGRSVHQRGILLSERKRLQLIRALGGAPTRKPRRKEK